MLQTHGVVFCQLFAAATKLDVARGEERTAMMNLNDHIQTSMSEYSKVNTDLATADEYRYKCILAVFQVRFIHVSFHVTSSAFPMFCTAP